MVQRAQMVMFIGSGLEALGSIPYKCMYIILFYFTIQFYFNFPFNYTYSLDTQSKTLLRYIHFTFVTLTVKSITFWPVVPPPPTTTIIIIIYLASMSGYERQQPSHRLLFQNTTLE